MQQDVMGNQPVACGERVDDHGAEEQQLDRLPQLPGEMKYDGVSGRLRIQASDQPRPPQKIFRGAIAALGCRFSRGERYRLAVGRRQVTREEVELRDLIASRTQDLREDGRKPRRE